MDDWTDTALRDLVCVYFETLQGVLSERCDDGNISGIAASGTFMQRPSMIPV